MDISSHSVAHARPVRWHALACCLLTPLCVACTAMPDWLRPPKPRTTYSNMTDALPSAVPGLATAFSHSPRLSVDHAVPEGASEHVSRADIQ